MIDLPQTVATLRHYAGWADKLEGRAVPTPGYMGRPTLNYTIRQPIGVVAAITPWNSPTMIGAWKVAPTLAAGCAVILKPPEDAPLTSLLLAQLAEQVGFPAGALSVLPGRGERTGKVLVEHPGVDKISFTGSPETGYKVATAAVTGFRPTTLELGGKSPQIVFADADLDAAADGVALGIFANQGEVCAAGSRILGAIIAFDNDEQAVAIANGNPYALAATLWTTHLTRAHTVARRVHGGAMSRPRLRCSPVTNQNCSTPTKDSWPSTFLPAFELVAATRRICGARGAKDMDYALRTAFFRDSVDVSIEAGLRQALAIAVTFNADIDPDRVLEAWMRTNPRADVADDFVVSKTLAIQGSPQIFWPDGSSTHNPGMTDHHWQGGLVRIGATDELAAERLLLAHFPAAQTSDRS